MTVTNLNLATNAVINLDGGNLTTLTNVTLGGGSAGNSATITSLTGTAGGWNGAGQLLTVGSGHGANQNALTLSGGVAVTNFSGFLLGFVTGDNRKILSNQMVVTGTGTRLVVAGDVWVGWAAHVNPANGGATYSSNQVLLVQNGATVISANLHIGLASGNTNNWMGDGVAGSNQVLVSGATWTNWNRTVVGESVNSNTANRRGFSAGNSLWVTNGSTFYSGNGVLVGTGQFATANSLVVSNNSQLYVGTNLWIGVAAGSYNSAYISNRTVAASLEYGSIQLGTSGGAGNTGLVFGGVWDALGQTLTIGSGNGANANSLRLTGRGVHQLQRRDDRLRYR